VRSNQTQRVVVIGGGYAGTLAAIRVAGRARRRARVILLDPKTEFVQRLRLHQVATGQCVAEPPYAKLLGRRVQFVQGWAEQIDTDRGLVEVAGSEEIQLPFDRLIYTAGSAIDLSSVPGVAEHAHSVRDVRCARGLSHALHDSSDGRVIVVVGGGLTGLEVASEIATGYPHLRVKLVTSGPLGGWLSVRAREYLATTLARQRVEVIDQARVQSVEADRVLLADGSDVRSGVVIWCGGFRASPLAATSGLETDELGRLLVDRTLRSITHPEIVAAGDTAATPPFVAGSPLRMCCQVAIPTGAHAANTVIAELSGREPKDLHFGYLHQPLSLGRRNGLIQFVDRADRPKQSILTGRKAALYKDFVSATPLPSFRFERLLPGTTSWPLKEPEQTAAHEPAAHEPAAHEPAAHEPAAHESTARREAARASGQATHHRRSSLQLSRR
jgi:NADH:quinone reductase (non-electrogenic)